MLDTDAKQHLYRSPSSVRSLAFQARTSLSLSQSSKSTHLGSLFEPLQRRYRREDGASIPEAHISALTFASFGCYIQAGAAMYELVRCVQDVFLHVVPGSDRDHGTVSVTMSS